MSRSAKRFLAAVGVVAVASVIAMAVTRKPVLFAVKDFGDASGQPFFTIMNPFRDRGPEHAAEAVFERLNRGETAAALAMIAPGGVRSDAYENERRRRLHAWRLVDRLDDGAHVELVYRTSRSSSERVVMPLAVHVKRSQANGTWGVTRFLVGY